jgi:hypothetical protein
MGFFVIFKYFLEKKWTLNKEGLNKVIYNHDNIHLAMPLMLFLKILGIVFKYLILPVPGPFLCWTFNDHLSI